VRRTEIKKYLLNVVNILASFTLAIAVLWYVAENSGLLYGAAYIHLSVTPSDVLVDGVSYHVATTMDVPIVCKLAPGKHLLQLKQNGRLLYEQEFTLKKGERVPLACFDRTATADRKEALK
jgi:hypothetical protein